MQTALVYGDRRGIDFECDPDNYDWVVFLGDYVDPMNPNWQEQLRVFEKIISMKRAYGNVVLLIGDVDYYYLYDSERASPASNQSFVPFKRMYMDNFEHFDFSFQIGSYLFSHAGMSKTFLNHVRKQTGMCNNPNKISEDYNHVASSISATCFCSKFNGGDDAFDGPLWIRPDQLLMDLPDDLFQVVGHTSVYTMDKSYLDQNIIKFCDNETATSFNTQRFFQILEL